MNYILGTAAFSEKYGIANQSLKQTLDGAKSILETADVGGILVVDTAPTYGDSQKMLGDFHSKCRVFEVHTKISGKPDQSPQKVLGEISKSLRELNVSHIEVLYFHSPEILINGETQHAREVINTIKRSGVVKKIGVSVYFEREVEIISTKWPQIEVFQVPENILDQRLINSQTIKDLSQMGKTFFVRSVFLQGLLLMDIEKIPKRLSGAVNSLISFKEYLEVQKLTKLEATLNYLNLLEWASGFLIGVHSATQLKEILNVRKVLLTSNLLPNPLPLPLVDPRNW